MKTKLILGSFLALAGILNGQNEWLNNGTDVYKNSSLYTGNVGVGTNTPGKKLEVVTTNASALDGLRVTRKAGNNANNGDGANIFLDAQNGGKVYSIASEGSGYSPNIAGGFSIYNQTDARVILHANTSGNVGFNTWTPTAKLHVVDFSGVAGKFETNNNSGSSNNQGVSALAQGAVNARNIGVFGRGDGLSVMGNIGGFFEYGFSVNPANDWAVFSNGDSWATGIWQGSDRKLKDNIKPIINALEKINMLKPSNYTFRINEFPGMNLAKGEQFGLIAQDVETVYPNCVRQVSAVQLKNSDGKNIESIPEHKAVNYIALIPVLIAGIQEQQKQIEDLQAQLAATQNKTGNATGINQINSGADGFALDQNVPNPFSGETNIKYKLTEQTKNASLIVYDLSGKQLTSFPLDRTASSITITSDKLAAGIYIYSVMADGKIMDSKRMVVADK